MNIRTSKIKTEKVWTLVLKAKKNNDQFHQICPFYLSICGKKRKESVKKLYLDLASEIESNKNKNNNNNQTVLKRQSAGVYPDTVLGFGRLPMKSALLKMILI